MEFLKAIVNDQEIILDEDIEKLLSGDPALLDEDALDRIAARVDNREIAYYAFLVGTSNALRAKLFKDRALEGKTVPSNLVSGYEPIVEMINDIILAGPNYITLLKNLHQRAKRAR